jgi:hypothetical protein
MLLHELFASNVVEAKGIFGRNHNDKWVDSDGVEWNFIQVESIPSAQENNGQFESTTARDEWVANFEKDNSTSIEWTNAPNAGMLAVGILTVQNSDGQQKFIGRYFKQTSTNLMGSWKNDQLPSGMKLTTSAGSKKLDAGLDPQNLIGNENQYKGAESIINTVNNNLEGNPHQTVLVEALNMAASGQLPQFPGMAEQIPVLRDYFGEIMGPLAMMGGLVTGDADQARQDLADGAEWKDLSIFWPQSMNYNLVDSIFIAPDGKEIGISSKGGKGAAASAKNLYDALKKNKNNKELMDNTKFVGEIVTIIQENSAQLGPLLLAKKFNLITDNIIKESADLINRGETNLNNVSDEAKKLLAPYAWKQEVQGFNVGFALISAVAKQVAEVINKNPEFSNQALKLLNTASIIQLYTKMGSKGTTARVNDLNAVYPPNFQGRIILDGGKNYYSSRIGGKLAFKFV